VRVAAGATLLEAAQRAGVVLNTACGGAGRCGKCAVEVAGRRVLACQTAVQGDAAVLVPEGTRFFEQKILEEGISRQAAVEPAVAKRFVRVARPSLQDLRSDAQRLQAALKEATGRDDWTIAAAALRELPQALRTSAFGVTAVLRGEQVIAAEGGDTTAELYGVAVDVGTTTVVASLVDLGTGRTAATASMTNPQAAFGDDVISRIHHSEREGGLAALQERVVGCVNELVARLCGQGQVAAGRVYELVAAGNATMQHLLLGVPAGQLAQAPYVGAFSAGVNAAARELGVAIHPAGNVYVLPGVAGHVGGDTVAVALATAIRQGQGVALALDVGTNGEVLAAAGGRVLACSTAAGPAFEGARIRHGMRGATGAIERVRIAADVEIEVIGGGPAAGICGSGLIDAVAALLEAGVLEASGRLLAAGEVPPSGPEAVWRRLVLRDGQKEFVLAEAERSRRGEPIALSQQDVREVQLGKAAIRAGTEVLLEELGANWRQVERVYLAGAFGNYVRPASAVRLGLLGPVGLERIVPVGNAAGAGAREVLLSRSARRLAERLAREIEYVELAGRTRFEELFQKNLSFPPNG